MKTRPTTEETLAEFLKELNSKRLQKNLSIKSVFAQAHVSLRDLREWTKPLETGEIRRFPLRHHPRQLFAAIRALPSRRELRAGRPSWKVK